MDSTRVDRRSKRQLGLRASIALAISLVAVPSVSAGTIGEGGGAVSTSGSRTDNGAQVSVGTQHVIPASGRSAHRGRGAPAITCRFEAFDLAGGIGSTGAAIDSPGALPGGVKIWRTCYDATGRRVEGPSLVTTSDPGAAGPAVTQQLIELALANLDIDLPTTHLSPPAETLPNLDTWFWTDEQAVRRASASAGGVTITVTAHLTTTTYEIGADPAHPSPDDGTVIRCAGAPTPYRPEVDDAAQRTSCFHRFAAPTRDVAIETTSTWRLAWTATNGETGDLGTIDRTTSTPYRVQAKVTTMRTS